MKKLNQIQITFLNANKYDDYKKYVTIFESSKDYNFRDNPNVFIDYINNNSNIGFMIIFDICINRFISKLYNNNFITDSDAYSNFSNYFINIFNKLQLPEYITKFTDIFFNKTVFIHKFQPLIINKNAYVDVMNRYIKIVLKEAKDFGIPEKRDELMKYFVDELKKNKMIDLDN